MVGAVANQELTKPHQAMAEGLGSLGSGCRTTWLKFIASYEVGGVELAQWFQSMPQAFEGVTTLADARLFHSLGLSNTRT